MPEPVDRPDGSLLEAFESIRPNLLVRDAQRLGRLIDSGRRGRALDPVRFLNDLQRAQRAAENRAGLKPAQIEFPAELPVSQARERLRTAIEAHSVVVVCGETGSGKTTQLPKLCLDMGRGLRGLIGHTQPRRLAARSVANRIARELNSPLGELVGYETRFDRRVSERSLIKLMTDGILLAELAHDRDWLAYDTIIVDEAHERSLNIDFILGRLKRLVRTRPELRVIVTSATLDPERLSEHFGGAPILSVEGRTFPVETRYRPRDEETDLEDSVAEALGEVWGVGDRVARLPALGDALVFLPGEREIREVAKRLAGRFPQAEVLPLYSRLPAEQQDQVFSPSRRPRVVLATNVAETSVTVPGIRFVIDVGSARVSRYSPRLGVQLLQIEPVSQAAAQQRAGRCGRTGPGVAVRLYPEEDFLVRPAFTDPEILRSNLAGVILQMAALGLGEIEAFDWVDAPDPRHVAEGYRLLQTLGALDEERRLTALGRELARLPLDPRIARIVLAARGRPGEAQTRVIAAALSVQDPHEVPPDQQTQARQKHAEWRHPSSDFLTLVQLWERWRSWSAGSSQRALRKLCREHHLSYLRMLEWEGVWRQLLDLERDTLSAKREESAAAEPADLAALYAPIHKALAAGLIDHIGLKLPPEKKKPNQRPERPAFQGPRGRRFRVFPGSTLAKNPPAWVLAAQLAQTSQLFARVCAEIRPEWLAEVAPHLVKTTVTHPQWNPERGEVQATEFQSLFGLPLLNRVRHYGSVDPAEARRLFISEALVRGNWPQKPRFLTHNLKRIAEVQDKEARLRRPDLLADESQLFAFYDRRLPADLCTAAGLRQWLSRTSADRGDPGRILEMSEADVLRPGADADVSAQFPDQLDLAGVSLKLEYRHDPSSNADGVSFHVPLAHLYEVPGERFDWLVPGLLPGRIEALIRGLPMALRKRCTPAATFASALAERMDVAEGAFLPALCRHLEAMTGFSFQPEDFEPARLEPHLLPRLVLHDAQGRVLAQAGTLAELQDAHRPLARSAIEQAARGNENTRRWLRERVSDWDFGPLPEHLRLQGGTPAYPALAPVAQGVSLKLLESPVEALAAHRLGVRDLLLAKMPERPRELARQLKTRLGMALIFAPLDCEATGRAIAERAAEGSWDLDSIRDPVAFQAAALRRAEFGARANALLEDVLAWWQLHAEIRKRIKAAEGLWSEATADVNEQLDGLLGKGFVQRIPDQQWPRVATWLKAAMIRLDRLPNKPQRDRELTAKLRPLLKKLPAPTHPARWLIEEWRIALFAQELKALGNPTAERIAQVLSEPGEAY